MCVCVCPIQWWILIIEAPAAAAAHDHRLWDGQDPAARDPQHRAEGRPWIPAPDRPRVRGSAR